MILRKKKFGCAHSFREINAHIKVHIWLWLKVKLDRHSIHVSVLLVCKKGKAKLAHPKSLSSCPHASS